MEIVLRYILPASIDPRAIPAYLMCLCISECEGEPKTEVMRKNFRFDNSDGMGYKHDHNQRHEI